ncbi:S9 family peptidase [Massilia arenosa]|uniref:S9 family peptidase n=1 Tax=Zemynaea arenosa TaxID=2561931 RepID=A0A4Y9SS00_9BURK|nr:prolyl oligopeptidase family serine peptidase [Massilia arenosa]TFW29391.1 S9 family peptidase [Massilia arenosa]
MSVPLFGFGWAQLSLRAALPSLLILMAAPAIAAEPALPQLAAAAQALAPARPLAAQDLQRRSPLQQVRIAPDGRLIAFVMAEGRTAALRLLDPAAGAVRTLQTGLARAELSWSNDSRYLFLDSGSALAAVDTGTGQSLPLATFDRRRGQQMVAVDGVLPHHALVEEDDHAGHYRLERIGLDGQRQLLYAGPRRVRDLLQDERGELAVIKTQDEDYAQHVARLQDGHWTDVLHCQRLRPCSLVALSADGRTLTMTAEDQGDRKGVVTIDLASGQRAPVRTDPRGISDLRDVVLAPATRQPMLAVYGLPRVHSEALVPEARRAAAALAERFPDTNVAIAPARGRWLLTETGAQLQHPRYWLFDPETGTTSSILAAERAAGQPLDAAQLAPTAPIDYTASDGMRLHGYLTLPRGVPAARAPLLTMVHGGPWGHFDGGYHWLAQLLATRGYAVFQPNFRSSTGYGARYMLAAGSDFGNGRVQRDIIEGVQWLTAHGIGDAKRMAILGDSFGGYSTLLALTWTPELFRFGLAAVPPTDFARTLGAMSRRHDERDGEVPFAVQVRELGIHADDPQALAAIAAAAPERHAGAVVRPLLILAGGKDDKVDIAGVTGYVAQLEKLERPVTLLVDPDEGHNVKGPMPRQAYAYLLERMLQRYLEGPPPTPPSPDLQAYLARVIRANHALPDLLPNAAPPAVAGR